MQKIISKYGLAAHLALVAVAPLFLSPSFVLWLSLLAAPWILMEPSRRAGEYLSDARRRVFGQIVIDPLFWCLLVIVGVTGFRALNTGIAMVYDAESTLWSVSPAKFPLMPGCVDGAGVMEFAVAVAMLVVLSGCRHALGKSARHAFFLVASTLSGLGAVVLISLCHSPSPEIARYLDFSLTLPSYAGFVFGVEFLFATVALVAVFEHRWNRMFLFAAIAIGGNAAGLFLFAPAWSVVLFAAAELILLIYVFIFARCTMAGTAELRMLVVFGLSLTAAGFALVAAFPEKLIACRIEPWMTGAFLPEGFAQLREALSSIALKVWQSHPWLGTGLGSFALDIRFNATDADWIVITNDQAASLNAYWQLLAERGIIGAALFATPLALLAWTYVRRAIHGGFHVFPQPACLAGLLILIVSLTEAAVDCSPLSPAEVILTAAAFALAARSFTKESNHGR